MNSQVELTLDEAVQEVLGLLSGLDVTYDPSYDRYRAIARQLNRALRLNALEKEWSYYVEVKTLGPPIAHSRSYTLEDDDRPRVVSDDAVRFVDEDGQPHLWAYFLPRDALHKYANRRGLWCSVTRNLVEFSRPFTEWEASNLEAELPIMREPLMFDLPPVPENPETPIDPLDPTIRDQLVDFFYPDVIILRAAYLYSMTDPVMQPRAQTLEAQYKDLMYQVIERDDRNTDTPFQNEFFVPVQNSIYPESRYRPWPLSDNRR